jgi:hypothetical protein
MKEDEMSGDVQHTYWQPELYTILVSKPVRKTALVKLQMVIYGETE